MDYKEMYLTMMRAAEKAINILIDAQRACEEEYLRQTEEEDQGKIHIKVYSDDWLKFLTCRAVGFSV